MPKFMNSIILILKPSYGICRRHTKSRTRESMSVGVDKRAAAQSSYSSHRIAP